MKKSRECGTTNIEQKGGYDAVCRSASGGANYESSPLYALFCATPDLVVFKDRELVYRMVNPAFCRFVGKPAHEIIGNTDYDLFPEEEAERYRQGDLRVMQSLQVESADREVTGCTGGHWFQVIKTPIIDGSGTVTGVLCSVRDVADRKELELEQNRFFSLLPDLVCIASTDGYFKKINDAWSRVLGYSIEELLTIPFLDLIHPDDREPTLLEVRRQLSGESTISFVNRYRTKAGSFLWFEWNTVPADGQTLYAVARDITERMEEQQQLRLWRDVFEYCSHGHAVVDSSNRNIAVCNPSFAALHGMSVQEATGHSVLGFYSEKAHERILRFYEEFEYRNGVLFEEERMRKDGTVFPAQVELAPVADSKGSVLYYILNVEDITRRKRDEAALRQSEERFRSVVESATGSDFYPVGRLLCLSESGCAQVFRCSRYGRTSGSSGSRYDTSRFFSAGSRTHLHA